ncbi:MAG: ankyrin repeat domain-containing protein [Candidatus Binatia bacterium]
MERRTPLLSLFAIAVILASFVNLSFIYVATNQPRVIRHTIFEESFSGTAAAMPRPKVAIETALKKGDVKSVKEHMYWCLKNGTCNLEKNLEAAVSSNNATTTKVLIAAGANVNAPGKQKETALHAAAMQGRTGIARILLAAGADVNARDADGHTPLHSAAAWGHTELARMLVAAGADVNAGDHARQTPLHLVASRRVPPLAGYADVARLLLDAGARPNLKAADGSTALRRAELAASQLTLDGNLKAAGDANEVVSLLSGSRGYH